MRKILPFIAVMMMSGCAVTREGIQVGSGAPPSQSEIDKIRGQVVHKLDDAERRAAYKAYVANADKWHPGQPSHLSEANFIAQIGGWSSNPLSYKVIPVTG